MTDEATLAFIQSLLGHGSVEVTVPDPVLLGAGTDAAIRETDAAWRAEMPGTAPGLDLPAARWALTLVHRISQFIIWRDAGEADLKPAFLVPCPSARGPETDYSADLFFRFLPALHRLAARLAPGDVLVTEIASLGALWPLSSPGIALPDNARLNLSPFISHPSLRRLYADRIIAEADLPRLSHPQARAAVEEALGAFPGLSPVISRALQADASSAAP